MWYVAVLANVTYFHESFEVRECCFLEVLHIELTNLKDSQDLRLVHV